MRFGQKTAVFRESSTWIKGVIQNGEGFDSGVNNHTD